MKKKAVIFGAGECGRLFLNTDPQDLEVMAFIDNDTRKHGKELEGLPIHAPGYILQSGAEMVCVASCAQKEIVEQLTQTLGLPESMIQVIGMDVVKSALVPKDIQSLREDLRLMVDAFHEAGIPWWLDHGSLLHFVRSGEFISSNDDVDICILEDHADAAREVISRVFHGRDLGFKCFDEKWDSPYWKPGDLERIRVGKGLDIQIKYRQADMIYWQVTLYVLSASKAFYEGAEVRSYYDMALRLPPDPAAYLAMLYGPSWQKPQPGWTFADYGNIVHRYLFFP